MNKKWGDLQQRNGRENQLRAGRRGRRLRQVLTAGPVTDNFGDDRYYNIITRKGGI
jgi:hypothetical protein